MKRALKLLSWGLVVGMAAGLLLAPEAGKTTRQRLQGKPQAMLGKFRNIIQSASQATERRMERIGQRLEELRNSFPDRSDVIETIQKAEGDLQRLERDLNRVVTERETDKMPAAPVHRQ